MRASVSSSLLALVYASTSAYAQSSVAQLVGQLRLAPSNVDRINTLSNDSDYIFNFLAPPAGMTTGAGGHTVAADSDTFAAVTGNGVSMTVGFLGPCGMNTPHTHPRATEINFSINTTLQAGFLAENGARFVNVELPAGSAAIFPQGAIHFEMNPSCEPAMFVAAFNSEDPGVQQVAQRYFGLPPDIVGAALGGLGVEQVYGLEELIPDNVALGTAECLQRCNITASYAAQATTQQQPRVSANAFPSGIQAAAIPAATVILAPGSVSAPVASASAAPIASTAPVASVPS